MIAGGVGALLLLLAGVGFFLYRRRRSKPQMTALHFPLSHALSASMRSMSRGSRGSTRSLSRNLSRQSAYTDNPMTSVASMYTNEAFKLDLDDILTEEQS